MTKFDADTAIAAGGWDSRYSRVIDVQVDGDVAAALIDPNGEGADLNVEVYMLIDGQWMAAGSGNGSIGIPGVLATWTDDGRIVLTRTDDTLDQAY